MKFFNILLLLLCALLTMLALQVYKLLAMPVADETLLMNQSSYNRIINLYNEAEYFEQLELARLTHPIDTTYNAQLASTRALVGQYVSLVRQANTLKNDPDISKQMLVRAIQKNNDIVTQFKICSEESDLTFEWIDEQEDDLLANADKLESIINKNVAKVAEYYLMKSYRGVDYFLDYEDVIMRKIGKRSIHDTLPLVIPNPIRTSVPERVQITVSKKYFDMLIDSLKEAGHTNKTNRNSPAATVELISDDCDVLAFNEGKQSISSSEYTTWEYQIRSLSPGVKTFKLRLGIVMFDSSDNEIIEKIVLPVARVTSK